VCWDNAAAESFFAALKSEMYHRRSWPTRARARFAVAEYIEVFYNRRRLHSNLGYHTAFEAPTANGPTATAA
jgi:putative transposase